ncbi:PREDICTED: probable G-protein coupled receptor 114 [Tinamus guttatus]|uniref:probable G-protein coupled receptor 114 n=1 Tax=Tinamus guttatus TaxID=94827 RepID=UPI00052F1EF3|nr:PREDICTED: probable G-protein coupled receptor 114 [Tinamus guttatus]
MEALMLATLVLAHAMAALQSHDVEENIATLEALLRANCSNANENMARLNWLQRELPKVIFSQTQLSVSSTAVHIHMFKLRARDFHGINVTSVTNEMEQSSRQRRRPRHAMHFPAELMKGVQDKEREQKLICIYIHSPCIFQDERNSSVLNDNVLGAFLPNISVTNLRQPVEIQFWHNKVLDTSNATCVFWRDGAGSGILGSWSSEGCETRHSQDTVLCRCNHLTYFAVLLVEPSNISQAELVSLTYISIVGCSISAAASLFAILLYCIFRRKKSDDTTKIHMNLLGALFFLNSGFLLSEPLALATAGLCRAAAAFLHGCLLCTLAWMAAEAFHLYLLLIKVYNTYIRRYLLKLCLFAWGECGLCGHCRCHTYFVSCPTGLPALAVTSILLFKKDTYGYLDIKTADGYKNATMCWLTSRAAHYSTLCFAGLILLFNTAVLLAVVRMLRSSRRQKGMATKDWATVLGLTCLLGTTWLLAFFSFGVFFVAQLYLFTILNSLQGLFICLWYHIVLRRTDRGPASTSSNTSK